MKRYLVSLKVNDSLVVLHKVAADKTADFNIMFFFDCFKDLMYITDSKWPFYLFIIYRKRDVDVAEDRNASMRCIADSYFFVALRINIINIFEYTLINSTGIATSIKDEVMPLVTDS